ncbi:MAG: hypothetical protein MUE83_07050 [Tabrizicola sp.]|jgi:hypothetical protein|nr:hypothetical protein [Tabrizicola sp.]
MSLPDRVALGTMHGKAAAIAPPLSRLGIRVIVPEKLDTDVFGTFTGETPRQGTMLDAARAKARAAIAATGLPVGLASEGAYGPHPVVPFLAQGRELLLWHDATDGREIVETLTDDDPCYDQVVLSSATAAGAFLSRIGFPDTAVVVSPDADRTRPVAKGIQDPQLLCDVIDAVAASGPVLLQTDMRAHLNPRRMATIGRLANRLAERLARACGDCGAAGWGFLRHGSGLPCSWCGAESLLSSGEVQGCTACGAHRLVPRPDGNTAADPGACPLCNP